MLAKKENKMSEAVVENNTQLQPLERKNYWGLDIAKFICALMIISAHFASEWGSFPQMIDYAFSIYVVAVPFFFACSGFLFFVKLNQLPTKEAQWSYFVKYEKRIWIMYGCWTAVYLPFIIASWVKNGTFGMEKILNWLHTSLVFQTYATIWFLPALAVGIAITYFLVKKVPLKWIIVISCVLYVIGMFGYTYYFVVEGTFIGKIYEIYMIAFKTIRNGLFNGVPFLVMGYMFTKKEIKPNKKALLINGALAIVSLGLMVVECFILKLKVQVSGMDINIFVVPFTYFFMVTAMNLELKDRKLFVWLRKLSLLMFVSQRLFLTALPVVLPSVFGAIYSNSYVGLIAVLVLTIGFSVAFIKISEKVKFFKYMI